MLADDLQRETLAADVASKLVTYGQSYLELWREDQGMFESIVADRLADVRPYSVFVGQVPVFAGKVAEKLAVLVETKNGRFDLCDPVSGNIENRISKQPSNNRFDWPSFESETSALA